tara:strand:+ start:548 stop:928 length:381 start_codon:yes stop_codon:yes gene_type:complete
MESLEQLFNKITMEPTETQIQQYNSETKVLIQNFETLKWLKTCIKEQKGVNTQLLTTFLLGLKRKFTDYSSRQFNKNSEVIKDFMLIYIKHIDAVISNENCPFLSIDFMIETAFQIHKMLHFSLFT